MLDFFELVGYLVSKDLLDKEIVENRWGATVKSLPEFRQVKDIIVHLRDTEGHHEAWMGVDSLIEDLGGSSHPFR